MGHDVRVGNVKGAAHSALLVGAVDGDMVIGIVVILQLVDETIDGDVGLLLVVQPTFDVDLCGEDAEGLVGQQALELESVGMYLSVEGTVGGHRELHVDIARTGVDDALQRCRPLLVAVEGAVHP